MYASLKWKDLDKVWYQSGSFIDVNWKCMIAIVKLQRGEGRLKLFDPKSWFTEWKGKMEDEYAWLEEWNYHKALYAMVEKVEKLFAKYDKTIENLEKKEGLDDHASVNHEGIREEAPITPSPYSSESSSSSSSSSHHFRARKAHKIPSFMMDVKFDLPLFSG